MPAGPCLLKLHQRTCCARASFLALASSNDASSAAMRACTAASRDCASCSRALVAARSSCAAASARRLGSTESETVW
jgi:hypothetical protein